MVKLDFMTDLLEYIRKRRAQLLRELEELDSAEKVYLKSQKTGSQQRVFIDFVEQPVSDIFKEKRVPRTIKQMVLRLLDESSPQGLTALEILERIQKRWKSELERTSLSPQLTRLKVDGAIYNEKNQWFRSVVGRIRENEPKGN